MVRRVLRVSAAALAVGLALSGCGSSDNNSGGSGGDSTAAGGAKTSINLLAPSYSDNTKGLWDGIIKGFEAKYPNVTVNLEMQSWDNINDVIRTKIQAHQQPDILNIDAFAGFAQDDLLYPAKEVLSQATMDDFQPSFKDNASIDGTMYGMPFIASDRTLFYNKDLLAKAGVTDPPKTWDDLLADAKKVNALGGGVYGYGMPLGNEEAQAETSIWTFGAGGDWGDASKLTINTPENLEGVTQMKKMIDEKATEPNPGATDRTPMLNVFIAGKIAMAEGLPPTIQQIKDKNPKLNWGTAPTPTKDGSPSTLGVADHLMAFKGDDAAKKKASGQFLDYFFSKDVYVNFVDTEGFLPTTKSGAEALSSKPELKDFLAALPTAKFYPSSNPKWSAAQGAMQSLIGQIGQGKSAQAVLQQVEDKANS